MPEIRRGLLRSARGRRGPAMIGASRSSIMVSGTRVGLLMGSFALLLLVGMSRMSAAKPPLGPATWAPPTVPLHFSAGTATILLTVAYVLGFLGVLAGLRSRPLRALPWPRVFALAVLALLTGPIGSVQHLSSVAYGRIALSGGDPYVVSPLRWREGLDPITSAVQDTWHSLPSVDGPLITALQTVAAAVGGVHLRETVWIWQLFIVGAWLAVRWLLLQIAHDADARGRVDTLWTFNPLLFGVVVLGAHHSIIPVVFALAAVLFMRHNNAVWVGVVLGAAVASSSIYVVLLPAIIMAWIASPQNRFIDASGRKYGFARAKIWRFLGGFLLIATPFYVVAGWHVLDRWQSFIGPIAHNNPWFAVAWTAEKLGFSAAASENMVMVGGLVLVALVIALTHRILRWSDRTERLAVVIGDEAAQVINWSVALVFGYLVGPWTVFPWFAALPWALLALLMPLRWDLGILGRVFLTTLAFLPGWLAVLTEEGRALQAFLQALLLPAGMLVLLGYLVVLGYVVWRSRVLSRRAAIRA